MMFACPFPSLNQVLAGSAIVLVCYFLVLWIYRLTFHPLAKYPGPFVYKLPDWPLILQAYHGSRHLYHLRDHEKYGPIVRIGPNTLSFNTESALNAIYGSKKVNVRKTGMYITLYAGSGALSTHTEINKEKQAYRRRVLSHAFSDSALRSAEPLILQNVNMVCNNLAPKEKHQWSEKKDMSLWCSWLGFDIMGDLAFGERFKCIESKEHRHMAGTTITGSKFLYWFSYLPCAWITRRIITSKLMEVLAGQTAADFVHLVNYAEEKVQRKIEAEEYAKKEKKEARKDTMHYILDSKDPETAQSLTRKELAADSVLLITAGSDTRVTSEVRSTFTSAEDIRCGPKLNSCIYLQACMEEVLRIAPPVPSHLPREVLPGGLNIDGHHIPAGTIVGVPAYSIHPNVDYFPEPWSFKPERWIVDSCIGVTAESVEVAARAFCPFSLGTRGCIGKFLAYIELKLALSHVLYQFDMREAAGEKVGGGRPDLEAGRQREDEFQMNDAFGIIRNGPLVQFKSI